ncbi:hypothetical protein QQF64_001137 [Cirrhinus molitorella]|uniref:DUF5641 domain-containing protein n=1 Tax=Cirrhinus molitorella TaxID=172907 RepID=A0ABR3NZK0_9TELE
MGRASLSYEELTSLLTEIEATINSRPLTFVYNDLQEPQPLTPAHFLVGKRLTTLPPKPLCATGQITNANREELTRRWKYRHRLINEFWNRWRKEYLLDLRSAHTRDTPNPTPLREGVLVLIGDDKMPRLTRKTGLIKKLFPGRDGLVRSCAVLTPNGTILRRPVQLLYPFEV